MLRGMLLTIISLGCLGCYTFAPAEPGTLEQGTEIRTVLSPPSSVDLPELTARSVVRVDGEVVTFDEGQAVFSAFSLTSESGNRQPAGGATVRIPRDRIQEVQLKRFDYVRTSGMLAGALVISQLLFDAVFESGGGTEGGGGGGVAQ